MFAFVMMKQKDIQGRALLDYFLGKEDVQLVLHTSYGPPEQMPTEVFFRDLSDFSKLEILALENCRGTVLDVGAGAGSFALELQEKGIQVTALEISSLSCEIMRQRGVEKVEEGNIWEYSSAKYETLLLMMNGIGLAGTLESLPAFLSRLKECMLPGGQIICDSSDISYLYKGGKKPTDKYFGEIDYCYEYEGEMGEVFRWLYADVITFARACAAVGLKLEVLQRNRYDQFLCRITGQ